MAVTVGMMTTGYDCQDILNIALMRPVFSPSEFVQMKGRGTRKWSFDYNNYSDIDESIQKERFKFFDFFATCEYFEEEFDYDEKIKLPKLGIDKIPPVGPGPTPPPRPGEINLAQHDEIASLTESSDGVIMKIDREGFKTAVQQDVTSDEALVAMWKNGDVHAAEEYVREHIFDKPKNF